VHRSFTALAFVALLGAAGIAFAQTEPGKAPPTAKAEYLVRAKTQKAYKDSKVLQVKIEKVLSEAPAEEMERAGLATGRLVFVHVPLECVVCDDDGKAKKRTKDDDEGWDEIDGKKTKLEIALGEKRLVDLKGGDVKGMVEAYVARRVRVLDED
jgi:hypothetical protein